MKTVYWKLLAFFDFEFPHTFSKFVNNDLACGDQLLVFSFDFIADFDELELDPFVGHVFDGFLNDANDTLNSVSAVTNFLNNPISLNLSDQTLGGQLIHSAHSLGGLLLTPQLQNQGVILTIINLCLREPIRTDHWLISSVQILMVHRCLWTLHKYL